jgi:hypothetical protein
VKQQIRYTVPGRYDRAPYNSLYTVVDDDENTISLYVQINPNDADYAEWIELGDLLKGAFKKDIPDNSTRDIWIQRYKKAEYEIDL